MNIWTVLKSFLKINFLKGRNFLVLYKISISVKYIYTYIQTFIHTYIYIYIYIYIHIYLDAVDVWNVFKRNTMGDYHDLYLKAGVFLLADVFETFINTCLEYYVLDSCHYFSSPGLS